ncbi:MAG: riboflavin synthase [Gammaproteobacteria bacterium]|nr:riboflavin synthase [Gammaproteobacteria bacterium]
MFTGIIQAVGKIAAIELVDGDCRLVVVTPEGFLADAVAGDSIAVNGVCLTAVEIDDRSFHADVSRETLDCTSLGALDSGNQVNLEPALRAGDRLGGHLVSGHVDAVTEVLARHSDARSDRIQFAIPAGIAQFIAAKGSICIDGTSLTVNEVESDRFGVNIVPHTREATIAGQYQPGTRVNLEVDLIARYVARVLTAD